MIDDEIVEKIKKDFDNIKSAIFFISPFLVSLIRKINIVVSDDVPTAGVDGKGKMSINPNFWLKLSDSDKAWLISHETMHIAFNSLGRYRKEYDRKNWNIATDGTINWIIKEFLQKDPINTSIRDGGVTMDKLYQFFTSKGYKIPFNDFMVETAEEVYRLIDKYAIKINGFNDLLDGEKDGQEIQHGDDDINKEVDDDKRETRWRDAVVNAHAVQKMTMGSCPSGLERLVEEMLTPKISWKTLLRQAFITGFGKSVVGTWRRKSRKISSLPGLKRYSFPNVHFLIDTSGSMGDEELSQGLGEIYSIAKNTKVLVSPWDAESYDPIIANNPSDVMSKVSSMLKGGGGTVVKPVLQQTIKIMKPKDIVVLFTDGDIYDLGTSDAINLLSAIAYKSGVSILMTTSTIHNFPGWITIKVDLKE